MNKMYPRIKFYEVSNALSLKRLRVDIHGKLYLYFRRVIAKNILIRY